MFISKQDDVQQSNLTIACSEEATPTNTFPRRAVYCFRDDKMIQQNLVITEHPVEISVFIPFRIRNDCSFCEVQVISEPFPCDDLLSTQAWLAVRQR